MACSSESRGVRDAPEAAHVHCMQFGVRFLGHVAPHMHLIYQPGHDQGREESTPHLPGNASASEDFGRERAIGCHCRTRPVDGIGDQLAVSRYQRPK
eukprot:7067988-Pyramimonas_sp.AAC.1